MTDLILYDHRSSICSQMARLALVEKGLSFKRRQVDIMETNEQFEPWYVALNPRAVVPTLVIDDEIVTGTVRIVNRVDMFDGPDLSGDGSTADWLRDIMALHYGVLLYRKRLEPDGTAPQIVARGKYLEQLSMERPDLANVVSSRLEGNRRFQRLLRDREGLAVHLDATKDLIDQMKKSAAEAPFLAGEKYSLADSFATAALARFTIHRLTGWWKGSALEGYYSRMKERPSYALAEVVDTGSEQDL